ncbi:hypothetical protein E2C01_088730 [Portunus trituberculatus]|uniref:Uncharacterized protein n=1 Tax=Portunus trituberculatus TaxID=210409 RepID=A0A5B7JHA0_PORTR|nr:hypothetical protein [Portunus trituberculatus]
MNHRRNFHSSGTPFSPTPPLVSSAS